MIYNYTNYTRKQYINKNYNSFQIYLNNIVVFSFIIYSQNKIVIEGLIVDEYNYGVPYAAITPSITVLFFSAP